MRKTFVIGLTLLLVVGVAASAFAKVPVLPKIMAGDDIARPNLADPNLQTSSSSDTFVFGPYNFDTGWAGWTKVDLTQNPTLYGHIQDLTTMPGSRGNAFTGGGGFTGLVEWTGTLGANACGSKACFPGYDNNSKQMVFKSYTISTGQHITFLGRSDSEPGYDYTYLIIDRAGNPILQGDGSYVIAGVPADRDTLKSWTDFTEGSYDYDLSTYNGLTLSIIFKSESDGGYSDGDCNYNSKDGLWEMDNVQVGADLTTWDAGANGWTFGLEHGIGTFAKLETIASLPNSDPCPTYCNMLNNVVTDYDATDPNWHPVNQQDMILSPVIDLTLNSKYPVGSYLVQYDVYADLPIVNGNFYFWKVRYQPVEISTCACQDPNDWSAYLDENTIYYAPLGPTCYTARSFNVSAKIPGHAQRVQIALGTLNYPYYTTTPGGNQSPYFDNVSLRAANVSAPAVVNYPGDLLQDAYPDAATFATAKSTAAHIDNAVNIASGRKTTREGDSTVVSVALSCNAGQQVEVDYLFKITPGPCLNTAHPWWVAYSSATKIASGPYAGFAVARADTARATNTGANAASSGSASFMSEFNEVAIAAGTTYAGLDGAWLTYTGGAEKIQMFPDDLFTPGTHIEWVVHTTYIPKKDDYFSPSTKYGNTDGDRAGDLMGNERWLSDGGTYDPTATFVNETMVLPSTSFEGSPSSTNCTNATAQHCFLYVDRTSNSDGAQYSIENAFRNLRITWDRYDVTNPTGSMGNDLGSRFTPSNYQTYPGDHAPGPLPSLLNELYKAILWQTGTVTGTNFSWGATSTGADAGNAVGLLDGWLRTTTDGKYLWVSGNSNAQFLNRTGTRLTFLNTTLGAVLTGTQYRDKNTSWGINLTGLGPDCTTGLAYGLRGNWCPQRYTYSYINKYTGSGLAGVASENWKYPDAGGTWISGVQDVATTGGFNFRTQLDAFSLHFLRQSGVVMGAETNQNITNWSAIALGSCFTGCFPTLTGTGVGNPTGTFENSLAGQLRPVTGETTINFSLATAGHVSVHVYDVSGRMVSTVVNANMPAGPNSVTWHSSTAKSGIYFYQIEANGFKSAKKIILVN